MKLIYLIASTLITFFTISQQNDLLTQIRKMGVGEQIWVRLPIAGSFEQAVMEQLAVQPKWEQLRGVEGKGFEEYRQVILGEGKRILHSELRREIVIISEKWVEENLCSRLSLSLEEKEELIQEFMKCVKEEPLGVYQELLLQIG